MSDERKITDLSGFVWSVADILRGRMKPSDYQRVILPFVVLRRIDCVLEDTKQAVLNRAGSLPPGVDVKTRDMILSGAAGQSSTLYNTCPFTFETLAAQNPAQLAQNLTAYVAGFPERITDIFQDKFNFPTWLKTLDDAGILFSVFDKFRSIDLHPDEISNIEMGLLFEHLIRRFAENGVADNGDYFTPREVVSLLVDLLIANDCEALSKSRVVRKVYDPACGTGGMLSTTQMRLRALNASVVVQLYGQEMIPESFGICQSDMLMLGHDPRNIAYGNTLTEDGHARETFHYMLSNPPYGVDWKDYQKPIKAENARDDAKAKHQSRDYDGRFGAGLPRISDGQLLFVQHMVSKMRDDAQGSRIGIIMNGSPLFNGSAQSGESEIRRWLIEQDLIEAIVALPTDLFYNTGIATYAWILSNRKEDRRRGKIQLIDATGERFWKPMGKSLGAKRRAITDAARDQIVAIYADMLNGDGEWGEHSKILNAATFGYREVRIERPLRMAFTVEEARVPALLEATAIQKLDEDEREQVVAAILAHVPRARFMDRALFDKALKSAFKREGLKVGGPVMKAIWSTFGETDENAEICRDAKGAPEPDVSLRDHELVPMGEDWRAFFEREVKPFVEDAWVDETHLDHIDGAVGRVGYEIHFNRFFYRYTPPRPLDEIDGELKALEAEIAGLLKEIAS